MFADFLAERSPEGGAGAADVVPEVTERMLPAERAATTPDPSPAIP